MKPHKKIDSCGNAIVLISVIILLLIKVIFQPNLDWVWVVSPFWITGVLYFILEALKVILAGLLYLKTQRAIKNK